jgi:hypothetical protein
LKAGGPFVTPFGVLLSEGEIFVPPATSTTA